MSKAFLPEDVAASAGPPVLVRPIKPQPITPSGQRRLVAERARLAGGDEAARARVHALDLILATVEVVVPTLLEGGAGFGCEIEVEDESGKRRRYCLVGPDEVDAPAGCISPESPVGRALLGRREGDVVELARGGKTQELTVVAVRVPADEDSE